MDHLGLWATQEKVVKYLQAMEVCIAKHSSICQRVHRVGQVLGWDRVGIHSVVQGEGAGAIARPAQAIAQNRHRLVQDRCYSTSAKDRVTAPLPVCGFFTPTNRLVLAQAFAFRATHRRACAGEKDRNIVVHNSTRQQGRN